MDFNLTKEQEMIRKLIRDFSEAEVAPGADERDRTGEFPSEIFSKCISEMDNNMVYPVFSIEL